LCGTIARPKWYVNLTSPRKSENADNEEPKKSHGGCGHIQPQIRKEGLSCKAKKVVQG